MAGAGSPYLYTEAARYDPQGGERFPAGARLMLVDGGAAHAFVPAFAASADAAVSFDGTRVLFAGKQKPGEPWAIWETAIAGSAPRRVTSGNEDCIRPFYMPGDNLVYARHTAAGYEIELAPLAGGKPLRLTYGDGDHIPSDVLLDGRVLFDAPHRGGHARGVHRLRGWQRRRDCALRSRPRPAFRAAGLFGRHRVCQRRAPGSVHLGARGGASAGAPERRIRRAGRGARLRASCWYPGGFAAGSPFSLRIAKIGDTVLAPRPRSFNELDPVLVRAHAVPKRHPSGLGDRDGANFCASMLTRRARAGSPRAWLRRCACGPRTTPARPYLLGQTPVDPDGSFFVQVPSERPIRFELLDGSSKTVRGRAELVLGAARRAARLRGLPCRARARAR